MSICKLESVMDIRREMHARGWMSQDSMDGATYTCTFFRREWAGVELDRYLAIRCTKAVDCADDAVITAALRCEQAEELFPDRLCEQAPDGRIVEVKGVPQVLFLRKAGRA